jgi:hypothetical protein
LNHPYLCGAREQAVNRFEVHDGGRAPRVVQVLAHATVPGASPLFASEMGQLVLDRNALTQVVPALAGRDELAEAML